jgi:uncharacterized protein (TIGR00297 family)
MTEIDTTAGKQGFSESWRKLVHVGLGFIAFSLGVLPWTVAAGCAFAAIVFNLFVLPQAGGGSISRSARGTDLGIVLYPISVFLLIVIFRHEPLIAAVGWIALAFGDGMATVIGRNLGGPRVPWNREKSLLGSLGFFEIALPAAWLATRVIPGSDTLIPPLMIVFVACGVAMIVESLDTGIDDNLTVPFAAALTTWVLMTVVKLAPAPLSPQQKTWLVVNCVLAVVGLAARTVNWSGFIGGAALGSAIIVFGGWQLYLVLLAFFIVGSGTTRLGMRRKAKMGLAQEGGGRRGFFHAFANVGTATILAFLAATTKLDAPALWLAAVASLATAAADTTASEIGQLIGRSPFMPLTFRRVEPGTEGAISIEGTLAGALAALGIAIFGAVAWVSWYTGDTYLPDAARIAMSPEKLAATARLIVMITASAVVASWIESVVGSWNRSRPKKISNGTLNFMNTAVGAALLLAMVKLSS